MPFASRWPVRLLGIVLLMLLFASTAVAQSAERYTLSGYVRDAASGESLIGASLYERSLGLGTTTNAYGFFSLTLPAGSVRVVVSYIGFAPQVVELELTSDQHLTIELEPATEALEEIEVVAERGEEIQASTQMSAVDVPVEQIQRMPALLGEVDVLKALQLLPGTQSGTEGTSGIYVRGGGPDQNLILLDGAPLYNVSHLFGFFSIFNADAIQNVRLIKGGFPARYGGRLSSVVDVNMKEGNLHVFQTDGAIGLLASRLTVQGPIQKDKTAFIVSGRRTYADLLARPFMPKGERAGYYFYDLNAKVNHIISPKDRVFLSAYGGDDRFFAHINDAGNDLDFGFGWGNLTSTLRWNHLFSDRLFSNVTLLYSRYRLAVDGEDEYNNGTERYLLRYHSGIRDWSARADFDFVPNPNHFVRFGLHATHHRFSPGALTVKEETGQPTDLDTTLTPSQRIQAVDLSLYVEDDLRLSSRLKANVGLHAAAFLVQGETYLSLQPRLSARYLVTADWAVKASYAAMQQPIHLLTNSSIGLPTDLWLPATKRVRPQRSHQVAAGVARTLRGGAYELSLEGYYKTMDGLIEYEEGAMFSFGIDDDWQNKVEVGSGRAYGVEVFLQRKRGRTTGWVGYTLAWADRQFDALNGGRRFPYRYDRRHDVAVVVAHRLSRRIDLAATWVYGTGNAVTLPIAQHFTAPFPDEHTYWFYDDVEVFGDRNGFRMKAYHRLDLGVNFVRETERGERVFTISVYNAYNHKNPFFLYLSEDDGRRVMKQVSLFPIIPSVSYRFQF